jgi:hypothetical protein
MNFPPLEEVLGWRSTPACCHPVAAASIPELILEF